MFQELSQLEDTLSVQHVSRKKAMILIGSFFNFWDEEYVAQTFESLGWTVKRFEAANTTSQQIIDEINGGNYRFLLTVNRELRDGNFRDLLGKLTTVFWLFDIYFGTQREPLVKTNPRFQCNYVFTTDGGGNHQYLFEKAGVHHFCLRQGICEADAYLGEKKKEFEKDIVFVGTINSIDPNRDKLVSFLQNTYGERFKWYGKTGPNEIRGKDLNDLYASVKIVVGDSCFSPCYWSVRLYDVLGRGGFLLFPDIPGLNREFVYYEHLVPYIPSILYEDLQKKIDYYLEHDEEREKIRLAGFQYCKEHYNFKLRCQKLLETIKEL
jgi:hypothetical protein